LKTDNKVCYDFSFCQQKKLWVIQSFNFPVKGDPTFTESVSTFPMQQLSLQASQQVATP
jgi:hypothetical protein